MITSLTLTFLDSIVKKKGIDYDDIMERFSDWLMEDKYTAAGKVFDAGNATSNAIINYGRGEEPLECGGVSEWEKDIQSSGYVVDTLESALWCLLKTDSYEEYVLKAVNLGGDTDTVGAMAGGLAGIYYGAGSIPKEWLDAVAGRQYIETLCESFARVEN